MLSINESADFCVVTWQFSNVCNFSCTYCPEQLHDGSYKFPKDYTPIIDFLEELSKKNKTVYLETLGGETTLWPQLIPFLLKAKEFPNVIIEVNTNGSRSNAFWKKFCDENLEMMTLVIFSYHHGFCNPDIFYDNLKMASEKYNVVSLFMLDPERFDEVKAFFEKVTGNLPVDVFYKLLREDFSSDRFYEGYNKEMVEALQKPFFYDRKKFPYKKSDSIKWCVDVHIDGKKVDWQSILINRQHKFKNWKCSAGSRRFFIDFNGNIWPCSLLCRWDLIAEGKMPTGAEKFYLGNVYKGEFKILDKYISCPENYCAGIYDAVVPKYAPGYKELS